MLRDADVLHGWTHTYLGATIIAVLVVLARPLCGCLMHSDMRPLAPLSDANNLLSVVSLQALHVGCVMAGILGLVLWLTVKNSHRGIE